MKLIPGTTYYFASPEGDIYSDIPRGVQKDVGTIRKLKPNVQSTGKYYCLSIKWDNGVRKHERVHRLVCMAYHGLPPFDKATVSHIDGNWRNNRPENLRWESYSDNLNRKKDHGTDDIGVKNSRSKINLETLIEIRKLLAENELTQKAIGEKFGLSRLFITKIKNGHRYKNQGVK